MRAIAHFSVGVSGMLLLLLFVNLDHRREFLLTFVSGFWAMTPDLGWLLLRTGMPGTATLWKAVFNSPFGYLFWFHPLLDAAEPENRVIEMAGAFLLLGFSVSLYYFRNDWESDRTWKP